jgi:hypothetical protein
MISNEEILNFIGNYFEEICLTMTIIFVNIIITIIAVSKRSYKKLLKLIEKYKK